ncbi:MAG: DUF309 domain-containing protein [Epsilonproteobacteria bacterium]|nr:DUF309 domain-containing protein [Campylobacterota bacterium]
MQAPMGLLPSLEKFLLLLKQENYFQAHEVLEEVWFPRRKDKSTEILVLKGFINGAVALELKKRGKIPQARRVWNNYIKYSHLVEEIEEPLFKEVSAFLNSLF